MAKLIGAFLRMNLQQSMAYRADTAMNLFLVVMGVGFDLLSLSIIFSNTNSINGWRAGDLIALLGVFRLVNMLMFTIISPNTEEFNRSVREGTLDYTFLLPANSQLLVTIRRMQLWRVFDLIIAMILITTGLNMVGNTTTPLALATFVLLIFTGGIAIYSLWIILLALTFWFTKFDNNVTLMHALTDTGRFPVTVYPAWLRVLVTYIVPIALATSIPLQALRGELAWWEVLVFVGVSVVAFLISRRIWIEGTKKYSGASS